MDMQQDVAQRNGYCITTTDSLVSSLYGMVAGTGKDVVSHSMQSNILSS